MTYTCSSIIQFIYFSNFDSLIFRVKLKRAGIQQDLHLIKWQADSKLEM